MGRPARLPATGRTRWAATARSSCAAPARWASRPGWGRWPSPTAGSATGRTASTAASACKAARSTPRPRPLITHIPDALAHGAEIRADCHGDPDRDRPSDRAGAPACTTSATAANGSSGPAMVAVAGYSIETPRLLLNSACSRFPDGLGNDFDQVGRYLMVQGAPQTAGRFDAEVRMYKAPPPEVSTEQFYETDPARDFQRGFSIQTVSPAAHHLGRARRGAGPLGRRAARVHARLRALGLPRRAVRVPARSRTTGSRSPRRRTGTACRWRDFSYSQCDNDQAQAKAAQAVMEDILHAAGADEVITIERYAHLVGGARMAARPSAAASSTRPPQLRRPQPVHHRRQRAAHPGRGQPGADHHGRRRPRRRPAGRRGPLRRRS